MNCFLGLQNDTMSGTITDYTTVCLDSSATGVTYRTLSADDSSAFSGQFAPVQDLDFLWVFVAATLVFFMQLGFSLLEAGAVKASSVQNILFKNLMDACIGGITFFVFGYGLAYGSTTSTHVNGFIGVEEIGLESQTWNFYFFQWAFAATAATIVSGAVAGRCELEAYFIYTIVITTWVYPVVVHWGWDENGWISAFNKTPEVNYGVMDFAGSGVVHMVGGVSGLMGAIALGPRFGRFDTSNANEKYKDELAHQYKLGNNVPFQAIGTLILWFGWYGFNSGSTLAAQGSMELASKVAVTTTLAAASGGITMSLTSRILSQMLEGKAYWSVPRLCNGILAGLVSITASCSVVGTGSAVFIGFIGALVYFASSLQLEKLKIDDPLDAFSVHGAAGAWGVISCAIFGTRSNILFAGYGDNLANTNFGTRLATQLCFVVSVFAWTAVNSGVLFFVLKYIGILKMSEEKQKNLDDYEHTGAVEMHKVASN